MFNNKNFITNDKFTIGVAYDVDSWIFGIDINFHLPGTMAEIGIGPFRLFIAI